jgi:hypothetical protein
MNEIEQILDELEEYFDDRMDADYQDGNLVPNKEMQMFNRVERLRALLSKPIIAEFDKEVNAIIIE